MTTETMLPPTLQVQYEMSLRFAEERKITRIFFDGTALVWERTRTYKSNVGPAFEETYQLSYRGERQALPSGAVPLRVLGGPIVAGQGWNAYEVDHFYEWTHGAVIYEREITSRD